MRIPAMPARMHSRIIRRTAMMPPWPVSPSMITGICTGSNGRYRQSVELGEDGVGGFGPSEGLGVIIVGVEIAVDGGLEIGDGAEDAALEALSGECGEEVLDGVEPGARGWREVEGPARMAGEPSFDFGMLMGGVVIKDGVDRLVGRHRALDGIEEADEFLMGMALHATAEDDAIEGVEGGKQGGRAVALVVMRLVPHLPGLSGRPGWVRSSAWIWDFSSIDSTTAWAGGCI